MSLADYDGLKSAIADHLDRDDLTDQIDDFIDLAEARHKREVRIREMLTRSSLTVDDRYVDLPTGFLEAKTLRLLTTPVTVMTYLNQHEMNRVRSETTGKPTYFTVHSQFEFDKSPDSSYSGEVIYYKSQTALSDSNTSNDILSKAPDLYLYGALVASAPFLLNDERIQVWAALYKDAKDALNLMDRRGVGPLVARAAGATP